ncbi:MAG: GNAT family N-acetyltransferase [Thermaurantiacus sp.]
MEVRSLGEADRVAATATLVTAFAADPVARWTLPDPATYLAMFPLGIAHMGGGALTAGGAFASGDMRAVALWLPPGTSPDMEGLGRAFAEAGVEGPEDAPAFFEEMGAAQPREPHWYLPFIGVDPAAQGRGLGSLLMKAALAEVDAAGLPAYLESTNPRNVPLYERLGFRVVGEIQVGNSPVMHPMWRPAGHG